MGLKRAKADSEALTIVGMIVTKVSFPIKYNHFDYILSNTQRQLHK
jgi:hypothetical protein